MIGNRQQLARLQSDFYRDQYHKILTALLISTGIILIFVATIIYFVLFTTLPLYYGSTTTGRIIPMVPIQPTGTH